MRDLKLFPVLGLAVLMSIPVVAGASPSEAKRPIGEQWRELALRSARPAAPESETRGGRSVVRWPSPTGRIVAKSMTIGPGSLPGYVRVVRDGAPAGEIAASELYTSEIVADTLTIVGSAAADTLVVRLGAAPIPTARTAAIVGTSGTAVLNGGAPIAFSGIGILNFNGGGGGDALEIFGTGAEGCAYQPDLATTGNGTIPCTGITFNFSNLAPLTISAVASLVVITGGSNDVMTVDSPAAGQNRISGTTGGVAIESVTFFDIPSVTLDVGASDAGAPDDTVAVVAPLTATLLTSFTVNAGAGTDSITQTYTSGAFDPHVVYPTAAGAGSIADFFSLSQAVNYTGVEQIKLVGQIGDGDAFGVDGTAGNDTFRYTTGATPGQGTVTGTMDQSGTPFPISISFSGMDQQSGMAINAFTGIGGSDTFIFDGTGNSDLIDVTSSGLDDTVASALYASLFFGSFAVIQVNAGDSEDTINVTPDPVTVFNIFGGNPGPPALPGDSLNVAPAGTTSPLLTPTGVGAGTFTFADRAMVTFAEIESAALAFPHFIPTLTPLALLFMAMLMTVVAWRVVR